MTCKHCGKGGQTFPYYIGLHGRADIVSHAWLHERCSDEWHDNWRANGMAFEHNDGWGNLFKNKNPKTEKSPPYTGSAKVNGVPVRIAAWVKQASDGSSYFNMKFEPEEPQKAEETAPQQDFQDDDIPF